jgi:hypothetical protein
LAQFVNTLRSADAEKLLDPSLLQFEEISVNLASNLIDFGIFGREDYPTLSAFDRWNYWPSLFRTSNCRESFCLNFIY